MEQRDQRGSAQARRQEASQHVVEEAHVAQDPFPRKHVLDEGGLAPRAFPRPLVPLLPLGPYSVAQRGRQTGALCLADLASGPRALGEEPLLGALWVHDAERAGAGAEEGEAVAL
jgi:hypothetical protein